ncbi:Hypothetical_protein [Hexamita inflata]|uniref:Hypothetical_protein n=1 Tax=Hexamita inflata TaxID=28002 RepID=A0AA86R9V6_9EUKA|nr:Hypothetical protein HINF_LOCUS56349 [Hexamita inflata]
MVVQFSVTYVSNVKIMPLFYSQQQFKNKLEEAPFNNKRNRLENALEVIQVEMKVFSKNVFELQNSFGLTIRNEQNNQKLEKQYEQTSHTISILTTNDLYQYLLICNNGHEDIYQWARRQLDGHTDPWLFESWEFTINNRFSRATLELDAARNEKRNLMNPSSTTLNKLVFQMCFQLLCQTIKLNCKKYEQIYSQMRQQVVKILKQNLLSSIYS